MQTWPICPGKWWRMYPHAVVAVRGSRSRRPSPLRSTHSTNLPAPAVAARPVSVGEHDDAAFDDAVDHRDMAEPQLSALLEDDHRADARPVPAAIAAVRLIPPCPGIAVDLDSRRRPRKRHALADIVEQRRTRRRRTGQGEERGGQRKRESDENHDAATLRRGAIPRG